MSWQKYTPTIKARPDVPVSISVPDEGSRGTPFLLIDEATMKALGWKSGARVMLSIGHGDHDGKIRLEPAEGEPLQVRAPAPKAKTRRHRISVGRLPCLASDQVRSACRFDVEKPAGGAASWSSRFPTRRAPIACRPAPLRPSPWPAVGA